MTVRQKINVSNFKAPFPIPLIKYIGTTYLAPIVNRHAVVTQILNLSQWR
jgi:hypothetical protein